METVSLSIIVQKFVPEFQSILTEDELESLIVLRHGLASVNEHDVWEIIHYSIFQHQQQAPLH